MTQELYDFLISQPVIDGKTMLFIYKNYNLTVNQFINNLNSLLNYRHKDSIPPDFIKIADIKTH